MECAFARRSLAGALCVQGAGSGVVATAARRTEQCKNGWRIVDVGKAVVSASIVPAGLLVYVWVRWFRFSRATRPSVLRRSMTFLSLATLSMSVLMVPALLSTKLLFDAGMISGVSDWILKILWCTGLLGAMFGVVLGALSTNLVRRWLVLVALLLTSLWLTMIVVFEPGA